MASYSGKRSFRAAHPPRSIGRRNDLHLAIELHALRVAHFRMLSPVPRHELYRWPPLQHAKLDHPYTLGPDREEPRRWQGSGPGCPYTSVGQRKSPERQLGAHLVVAVGQALFATPFGDPAGPFQPAVG